MARHKRTRDELIGLVTCGILKPDEAEAEAKGLGLTPLASEPPLNEFDPMQAPQWSLLMAIAWIAWRDIGLVRQQQPEFRMQCTHWLFRNWREPSQGGTAFKDKSGWLLEVYRPSTTARLVFQETFRSVMVPGSFQKMKVSQAETALWRALSEGALTAIALDKERKPIDVPQRDWSYLALYEERDRDVLKYAALDGEEAYVDVKLQRDDLMRLWPRVPNEIPAEEATDSPIDASMLRPILDPGSSGFVPLCAAIQWIMTGGGTRAMTLNAPEWGQSVQQLWPKICGDEIELVGLEAGQPRASRIPGHTLTLIKILPPLRQSIGDILLGAKSHISCTPYVDQKHWEEDFNDKLYETGKPVAAWSHLQVRKSQFLASWPRSVSASNVEQACYRWLLQLMQASPLEKPKSLGAFRKEARKLFPRLMERQFLRVWARANADSGAQWSKAGRPRKSNHRGS